MNRIAIVRVRGVMKIRKEIEDTMKMLKLYRKNSCVIVPNNPHYVGMIKKVKDYITWGEIEEKTFRELLEKRGKLAGKQKLTEEYLKQKLNLNYDDFTKEYFTFKKELKDVPGLKKFFKLHPPIGGYERKGTKKPYSLGGSLGYRKEKINELIRKMV